jgi:hypothetical protein
VIKVEASPTDDGWSCVVEVTEGGGAATRHSVHVTHADVERWGRGEGVEELVRRSFEFLLSRESASQILKSFDLADIQRYFPDYAESMAR